MICPSCAAAGRLAGQPPDAHPEPRMALMAHRAKMENLHRNCESPMSCTCQHKTVRSTPHAQS